MKAILRVLPLFLLSLAILSAKVAAQDWVHTGTNLGNQQHPDCGRGFQAGGQRSADAGAEGGFRRHAVQRPGQRGHLRHGVEEPGAAGDAGLAAGDGAERSGRRLRRMRRWWRLARFRRTTGGWWCTAGWTTRSNTANPQVLGKQYNEAASEDMARTVAHRFADEIIYRLGGGINGIAETKIYFVSSRSGSKEIWVMDYDGQNQHQITHLGTHFDFRRAFRRIIRGLRLLRWEREGWAIRMYSLELGRLVSFPGRRGGRKQSVAGMVVRRHEDCVLVGALGRSGDLGCGRERRQRCTGSLPSAPTFRRCGIRRTEGADRVGERAHGRAADLHHGPGRLERAAHDRRRLCGFSFVVAQRRLLTFSWNRKYGPGDPGGQDIYVMDIASKRWLQADARSRAATIFRRGRRMGGTLCFSGRSGTARRSGRCWRTAPISSS